MFYGGCNTVVRMRVFFPLRVVLNPFDRVQSSHIRMLNFIITTLLFAVVSGACYRLFIDGLSGMVKGAVLGTLVRYNHQMFVRNMCSVAKFLSIPASLVIVGIDKLFIGPDVRKEMARTRLEAKQKKDELW